MRSKWQKFKDKFSEDEWELWSRRKWQEFREKFSEEEWQARIRRRNLRRDYGITPEEWNRMYEAQTGVCAICGNPESLVRRGKVEVLSVDHCHETKKVRGLLCGNCNNGLGRFAHDPDLLRQAARYLEEHQATAHDTAAS